MLAQHISINIGVARIVYVGVGKPKSNGVALSQRMPLCKVYHIPRNNISLCRTRGACSKQNIVVIARTQQRAAARYQ